MDIDSWLRGIGLAQYAEMFRANDIDIALLGRLSNDDLKEIGVESFGHRKKLLEAIVELAGASPVSPQPPIEPKAHDAAERRQVTVMFSDLVGSTALSARMDPEDLREVITAYQKCVSETVRRFGGFVAKYMGDGVRCLSRSRGAVPGARGEAKGDSPAHDRASPHGYFLSKYGRHRGRPGPL